MAKNLIILVVVAVIGFVVYGYARGLGDRAVEERGQSRTTVSDEDIIEKNGGGSEDNENEVDNNIGPEVGYVLQGQVVMGPTCAGPEVEGEECPDVGFETEISIREASTEKVISRVSTTALGEFNTILPSGKYELHAAPDNMLPSCTPLVVTVPSISIKNVLITCDSGIR